MIDLNTVKWLNSPISFAHTGNSHESCDTTAPRSAGQRPSRRKTPRRRVAFIVGLALTSLFFLNRNMGLPSPTSSPITAPLAAPRAAFAGCAPSALPLRQATGRNSPAFSSARESVEVAETAVNGTLPGGCRHHSAGVDQPPTETPADVRHNQRVGTAAGYREQAIADGIPLR